MGKPITVYYPSEIFSRQQEGKRTNKFGTTTDQIERYCLFKCREYKMIGKKEQEIEMQTTPVFHIGLGLPTSLNETITQNWNKQALGVAGVFSHLGSKLMGKLGGILGNTISAGTGIAINPAEELVYSGPEFRSFSFKFDFIPRSEKEERYVKLILLLFKEYSLPQLGVAEAYITFPALWEIEISGIDSNEIEEENLLKFGFKDKFFALTHYNVSYTPDESGFTSFHDGWPTKTSLSLNFQETMPLYRERKENDADRAIQWIKDLI